MEEAATAQRDPSWDAVILHVDMDAFFLAVELLERPELRGRPALVAGSGPRSVVLSASYEARTSGIRSAMPLAHARALCPQVAVVEPHHERYVQASRQVMAILSAVTPLVEQLSIDEAFLDVSGSRRRLGAPRAIAESIRAQVRRQTGLACTVGAAATKSVAKIASTRGKPDGLVVVPPHETRRFLDPLPVSALWGVGPRMHERLEAAGLATVGQLAAQPAERLERWLGVHGAALAELARGIDRRPVTPERQAKTLGVERTFDEDVADPAEVHRHLVALAHECAGRLRAAGHRAAAVSVKVKAPDRSVRTRTATLPSPVSTAGPLAREAARMLAELMGDRPHPVRLLGLRAERLSGAAEQVQEALLWTGQDESEGWEEAEKVTDDIRRRFPSAAVRPATLLGHHLPHRPRDVR